MKLHASRPSGVNTITGYGEGYVAINGERRSSSVVVMPDRIETGTVFMNRCDYLDPALAWTGVKHTGRGATLSRVGYETLTRPKSFHLRYEMPA